MADTTNVSASTASSVILDTASADLAITILGDLIAASNVAPPVGCLPFFDKTVKVPSDTGVVKPDGTAKMSYTPFKTPGLMTLFEYMSQPSNANWTADKKTSKYSILPHDAVLLQHLVVHTCCIVKVYGQFGKVGERYAAAASIVQHILDNNKVYFPHTKLIGCKLKQATAAVIKEWVESLCDSFSGNDTTRFFEGDGAGDPVDAGAVAPQVLTDGSQATAEELYQKSLTDLHGQKASRAYKTNETNAAQQRRETALLDNIASVMSGIRPVEVVLLEEDDEVGAVNSIATGSNNNVTVTPRAKRGRTPVNVPLNCIHCNEDNESKMKIDPTKMLVSCASCGRDSDFSAYDSEVLAAACTNSGSGGKMGTATYAAKTAYMSTIVAMKEADNTAKMMENQKEEILLRREQQISDREERKDRDALFVEQQKAFVSVLQGLTQKNPMVKFEEDKAHLERMLANGTITEDRYKEILAGMERQLTNAFL